MRPSGFTTSLSSTWMTGFLAFCIDSLIKVHGKALNRINLFRIFVKLVNDIGEEATAGGGHAVGHIGGKLSVRFGKVF
ncbi:MAG: hypothetical protein ACI4EJ_07760 [Bacteroides sp.]